MAATLGAARQSGNDIVSPRNFLRQKPWATHGICDTWQNLFGGLRYFTAESRWRLDAKIEKQSMSTRVFIARSTFAVLSPDCLAISLRGNDELFDVF